MVKRIDDRVVKKLRQVHDTAGATPGTSSAHDHSWQPDGWSIQQVMKPGSVTPTA
jgi:hypothetical protein